MLAETSHGYRHKVRPGDPQKVHLVLAVIGLVWPGIPELAAAAPGNPIVEFMVRCFFMRVRNQDKAGGYCPQSRLYFLR